MKQWVKDNDILIKVLSLLVALLLWFYVMDTKNPDVSTVLSGLNVQVKGVSALTEAGLIITEGNTPTVDVKVVGKRNDVYSANRNTVTAVVDVSTITVPGEYDLKYAASAENKNLTVSRITPTVSMTIDRVATKSVPVDLQLQGELAEGYVQGDYSLSSDAVTVEGPERILAEIDRAVAVYDMTDATANVETVLNYTLVDEAGEPVDMTFITLREPTLEFEMQVHQSGEIPLSVDVIPYGFITADMVDCEIEPDSVKVSGASDVVSSINQINLGSISVKQLLEDNVTEVTLPIILPNGVTTDNTETYARVVITFKGLRQMMFSVDADRFSDVEPYTCKEDRLSLVFLGSDEELAELSAEDITVTPVFSPDELQTGENVVPALVTVQGRQVAVVGKYTLTLVVPEELPPGEEPPVPEE